MCNDNDINGRDLKKHLKEHASLLSFNCKNCDRIFNQEWKMQTHLITHAVYLCDIGEKTFKYEEIRKNI